MKNLFILLVFVPLRTILAGLQYLAFGATCLFGWLDDTIPGVDPDSWIGKQIKRIFP